MTEIFIRIFLMNYSPFNLYVSDIPGHIIHVVLDVIGHDPFYNAVLGDSITNYSCWYNANIQ